MIFSRYITRLKTGVCGQQTLPSWRHPSLASPLSERGLRLLADGWRWRGVCSGEAGEESALPAVEVWGAHTEQQPAQGNGPSESQRWDALRGSSWRRSGRSGRTSAFASHKHTDELIKNTRLVFTLDELFLELFTRLCFQSSSTRCPYRLNVCKAAKINMKWWSYVMQNYKTCSWLHDIIWLIILIYTLCE